MNVKANDTRPSQIRYVAYDSTTGRILRTHARLDAVTRAGIEIPDDELARDFSSDPLILARLTRQDVANLAILRVEAPVGLRRNAAMAVDLKTRRLVQLPTLRLSADRTELAGDGTDTVTINVQAVDEYGEPVHDIEGNVRVATERGRLSERGGIVGLVRGHGQIRLTSVNETVRRVMVRVEAIDPGAAGGTLQLEFV